MSPFRRRAAQSAGDENEFESMWNQTMLIPSRPPLNSIPDPSQYQSQQSQFHFEDKPESSRRRKHEGMGERQLISSIMRTPKVNGRARSANSEPNSAQSTPSRSGHRVSIGGSTFTRLPSQFGNGGGRAVLLHRDSYSRRFSIATPQQLLAVVPHFDLDHDPSFWNDHNVQVLIRIRPLNSSEMVSQGYGRCLRQESPQTVVWQGHPETRFTFDHISCESISQEKLFRVVGLPMVDNCMSGYNSCMFAYGQTGSGKTYTMMGDIDKMDGKLSEDCGITPRIFEYLFSRIRKEEESRVQERLSYSCKCSFLEIYNEQITDLLEPSSINLQLREDMKKGVYVENLSEHRVRTVNDVLQLLQQGAANRKIAATYMNSESSRSHSVFTCVIESRWEKDSMAHLRFGRLNLVDLAGSERQKTSGAEGDRLKEAANINKSLSTLGLVIMSLVDLAQGKHRHVPYRDSRLTFLLQDSLGGNSKTTIIANVSPSICSANETLSTLKFAQRAKLIQNNAKINEDASAGSLQHQIQQLKDQLSFLMKHQHSSIEVINIVPGTKQCCLDNFYEPHKPTKEITAHDMYDNQKEEIMKNESLKAILQGALRRERLAETELRSLKAEIEHLNRLSHQQEEETQRTKMMLKFREDKIKRLELLLDGLVSADKFYSDENSALREENQLLQAKIERNPEVIRFALENIRLLEQIRQFQEFYQQGERETLLAEISELRNQFLESREVEKSHIYHQFSPMKIDQEHEDTKELVLCKHMNSNLLREVDELQQRFSNGRDSSLDTLNSIDNVSLGNDCVDEVTSNNIVENGKNDETDNRLKNQYEDLEKQLMDAQSLIETMKFEQFQLLKKLESSETQNQSLVEMLERNHCLSVSIKDTEGIDTLALQAKLKKMTKELKEAKILNEQYVEDHAMQSSEHHQTELVRSEAEMETTRTIIHLQEEIDRLQSEFHECLCSMTEENLSLRNCVAEKEEELRVFCAEWERATLELTTFLMDGSRSLRNASHQIKSISSSFPNVNDWINEHVERAAQMCVEKEETILLLQKRLEDAQYTVMHIEEKLYSLRGAAISLTEFQQPQNTSDTEEFQMFRMPNESALVKESPENRSWSRKSQIGENQAINCFTRTPGAAGNLPLALTDSLATTDVENQTKLASLPDVDGLDRPTGERAEASMNKFGEVAVEDKHSEPSIFFANFEEAFAAMKEADHTLKAMLKANENANTLTTMWKEAAEELMSNSASMREETIQFKSGVSLGDKDKEVLQTVVQFSLNEMDCMLAFLEEGFPAMQIEVEKLFETTCSDAKKIVEQTLAFFGSCRSSLEDLTCKALQNDISILVLQSQMGEYSKHFKSLSPALNSPRSILQEHSLVYDDLELNHASLVRNSDLQPMKYGCKGSQIECASREEIKDLELVDGDTLDEHSILQRELQRKDVLLKGLLFDFSLLQEFASDRKDIKDELEKLIVAMNNVQQQLQVKSIELDNMLIQKTKLEDHFSEAEQALFNSNSELSQTKETLNVLSDQNIAMKDLSKDLYMKNSEAEQLLEDQRTAIQSLEKEIVRLSSLHEKQPVWSKEDYEDALTEVTNERDLLLEKLTSLQDKLDMVSALADENQAIAAEARQESETSKCYAEQKEEEVKILERCVEELESTINVLEKRVLEMEEDVEKQRRIRDSLELEIQELRDRLLTVEDLTESMTSANSCAAVFEDQISRKLHERSLEINEARSRIRVLEEENAKQAKEIRQFKDYISELILHAEAQASQYQQKYKSLEAMLDEVKTDVANVSAGQISERADKISARTRGSSPPFRCISTLVQQMNQEKDQELSSAKSRIEELEALAACRYKEVCALNTKLASAESMTHDVIRDLLSVKLDISNYANIIEQDQLQKLIEEAHQHRQNFVAMERKIVNLRSQINDLHEDRERCISEMNKNNRDQLTIQIALEHLQERDQLLTVQNDMLKTDKTNLQKKVAELDDMVRKLFSTQESQQPRNQPRNCSFSRSFGSDLSERLAHSQKVISRVNDQLAQYRRPDGSCPDAKVNANTHEAKLKGCKNRYQNHL